MADTLLSTRSLKKRFGAVQATDDLSLEVARGELHALIGPNGAGKTTALNQLSGELAPDSGEIYFEGRPITHLRVHRRARMGLARSYQITSVFDHLTVRENLALAIQAHNGHNFRFWRRAGADPLIRGAIDPAMARVGLEHRSRMPAANLSHGERRQLDVGMALAGNPKMLLLDEPYAGMGPGGAVELTKLIRRLKNEVTILLVEQNANLALQAASRGYVLETGTITLEDDAEKLLDNPEIRKAYLGE